MPMNPKKTIEHNLTVENKGSPVKQTALRLHTNENILNCLNCNSIILQKNIGTFVEMDTDLPLLGKVSKLFKVNDIFDFENVAVSRKSNDQKYLACADCELAVGFFKGEEMFISFVHVSK